MPAFPPRQIRAGAHIAAAAVVLLAALLRLDAFVGKYGTLDRPAWARVATQYVAPLAAHLRPASAAWAREKTPYVGGDPVNYLKYAREMTSFYQGNVREPGFPTLTRAGLWLLDGQDAAVSLASAVGSVLLVLATYLLGAALRSPAAGLLAALLMAVESEAIAWAPDGWRDDAFAAAVIFAAWALLRLRGRLTTRRALVAGVCCAAACLTRITALTFVLPAFAWFVADGPPELRRVRARAAVTALLAAAVLVAPYLINSARSTGDPLYALNYHTTYYRYAEGADASRPMTAAAYLKEKLATRPVGTVDTAFIGVFVQPFATKWFGWDRWSPWVGRCAAAAALAGLACLLFTGPGRLLLVILLTSMLPYAFTWDVGSGRAWRFTMHALPLYLAAAAFAAAAAVGWLARVTRERAWPDRDAIARAGSRLAVTSAIALAGITCYFGLPWFVVREAIAAGDSTSIETGRRDLVFYRAGWSPPHQEGIVVRVSTGEWGEVKFPLPVRRDYEMVLRLDPVAPESHQRVRVQLNQHAIGTIHLGWDPVRVGSYRLRVPAEAVRVGGNELELIPEPLVAAGSAGPRFAWLAPSARIGVRLWYVRVLP